MSFSAYIRAQRRPPVAAWRLFLHHCKYRQHGYSFVLSYFGALPCLLDSEILLKMP